MADRNVFKRGNVVYIRYEIPTGKGQKRKQKMEACPGLNVTQARLYRDGIIRRLRYGTIFENCTLTLGEYLDQWIERRTPGVSPTTLDGYTKYIRKHIKPALGSVLLTALQPITIQELYDELSKKHVLAPKSIRNLHGILRTALGAAVKLGLIERNPAEGLDLPRLVQPETKTATEEDMSRLLKELKGSKYLLPVIIGISTGMRRGEVLGLRWEDLEAEKNQIVVRHSLAQIQGRKMLKDTKSGKAGIVAIPPSLTGILSYRRWQQEQWAKQPGYVDEGWICCEPKTGKPLSPEGLTRAFSEVTRRLGIDLVFHGLRHTQVTVLLDEGIPIKTVSERVRHSDPAITLRRYAHATPHMQAAAVEIVEGMLTRVLDGVTDELHPKEPLSRECVHLVCEPPENPQF